MGLGAGTIYTESPYDWFERPAKPELRESSIRCSAPERWSEIESADGPALRGSCADEAAVPNDMAIHFPKHQGVKCYAMLAGQCWLVVEGVPVLLQAGDCFLLAKSLRVGASREQL